MCHAKSDSGEPCLGKPVMVAFNSVGVNLSAYVTANHLQIMFQPQRGKCYFVGCSKWTPSFRGHRFSTIPDYVDESLLSTLFGGKALPGNDHDHKCSRVISSHIGRKLKFCGELVRELLPYHALIISYPDSIHPFERWPAFQEPNQASCLLRHTIHICPCRQSLAYCCSSP
jgi:hypothetical protein